MSFLQICMLFSPNSPFLFYLCYAGLLQIIPSHALCLSACSYHHTIIYLDLESGLQPTMRPEAGTCSCSLKPICSFEPRSMLATGICHSSFSPCECDRGPNTQQPFWCCTMTRGAGLVWSPASLAYKAVCSFFAALKYSKLDSASTFSFEA